MSHRNIFAEESVIKTLPSPIDHFPSTYGFNISGNGEGVKIAILDTGEPNHKSIKKAIETINLSSSHSVSDNLGQSSIIGGIINGNDPQLVMGMTPMADVYYIKISTDEGIVELDSITAGFLYAMIKEIDIILLSMTTDKSNQIFKDTVQKAVDSNICVVCSAGCYGYTQYPPAYDNVLSVGSLKQNGTRAGFSAEGIVNAVGTSVCSTYVNETYCTARGSAISTAIVGGLTALVIQNMKTKGSVEPIKVYEQVKTIIKGKQNV